MSDSRLADSIKSLAYDALTNETGTVNIVYAILELAKAVQSLADAVRDVEKPTW